VAEIGRCRRRRGRSSYIIHSRIIQDRQMSSSISQKLWVDGRKCCPIIGRQEESNGGRIMSSLSSTKFLAAIENTAGVVII
jgi:hypothetical protein